MKTPFGLSFSLAAVASVFVCAMPSARATTYYWDNNAGTAGFGTAGGTWSGSASLWNTNITGTPGPTGTVVTTTADTLSFGITGTGLSGGTITMSGTVNAATLTVGSSSGTIIIGTVANEGMIDMGSTAGTITTGAAMSLRSVLAGTAGFTKAGSATLTLSGTNTFSGATIISAGTLSLGTNALALQNSALNTLNSLSGTASAGLKISGTALTLGGLTGNKNLASVFTTTSGGYSGLTALTLNPGTGATASYSGVIANGAAGMTLTKTGLGTQILTGTNTYSGATTVTLGTLSLGSNLSATSAVIVDGGTLTSSVANVNLGVGAVSMSSGAITPGGAGTVGSFTLAANQAFSTTGGTLNIDLISSVSFDQIIGSGTGTFSLTDTTLALSGLTSVAGTYQLFSGFGGTNSVSGLTITGLDPGLTGSLDTTGLLTIAAIPEPSTYSALLGALTLGTVVWRRNRRQRG